MVSTAVCCAPPLMELTVATITLQSLTGLVDLIGSSVHLSRTSRVTVCTPDSGLDPGHRVLRHGIDDRRLLRNKRRHAGGTGGASVVGSLRGRRTDSRGSEDAIRSVITALHALWSSPRSRARRLAREPRFALLLSSVSYQLTVGISATFDRSSPSWVLREHLTELRVLTERDFRCSSQFIFHSSLESFSRWRPIL
jgi:hypothetical protein